MAKSKNKSNVKKWSPPKNSTMSLSALILILGAIIGIGGFRGEFPNDLIPIGINTNFLFAFVGMFCPLLSYLIIYLGVISKKL